MPVARVRVAVWCDADQVELVGGVAACEGVELVGVCAGDGVRTTQVAQALGAPAVDDPRQLGAIECDAIWLATDATLAPEALLLVAARGCAIATAPHPATLSEFAEVQRESARTRGGPAPRLPRPAPLLADGLATGDGAELLRQFGRIDGAAMAVGADPSLGGVGSRVLDVADCAIRLLGAPETVVASFVPTPGAAQVREDLRGLCGTLALTMRMESSALAATISTHGGFGGWMTLFGPAGRIEVGDRSMRWLDHDAQVVDELRPRRRRRAGQGARAEDRTRWLVATIAEALRSAAAAADPTIDLAAALAVCEATRLSCRTRSPESPALLRRTLAAPPQG